MYFHCVAQKMGLIEAPELLLSEKEWKEVKEKSNSRQDSALPCVICKEDFGLQQQVRIQQLLPLNLYESFINHFTPKGFPIDK